MVEFLLNQRRHQCAATSADTTVLNYLREHLYRCGTKEGCASGDCGACTVVVAERDSDHQGSGDDAQLRYRAVNSCITFVGSLHGKQLITVEDLASNKALHPVQQALYEHHASQCGFCTPGFVMSMFALWKNVATGVVKPPPQGDWTAVVEEHLGGNLCRCTGYRPIVDAAVACLERLSPDHFSEGAEHTLAQLQALQAKSVATDADSGFHLPASLHELDQLLSAYPEARLLAGGTDLALEVTQQLKSLPRIIALHGVAELRQIEPVYRSGEKQQLEAVRIGAAVTLSDCQQQAATLLAVSDKTSGNDTVRSFVELLHRFGSTPVRNQGTIGGNIANASPIGDLPPVLMVLDAELVLYRQGRERLVAINDFFTGYRQTLLTPGEIIKSIVVPQARDADIGDVDTRLLIHKISKRFDDDISALCMAVLVTCHNDRIEHIRLAFGGMAAVPKRALATEAVLRHQSLGDDSVMAAAQQALVQDFDPIDDVRASAQYRLQVAQNLLLRVRHQLEADDQVVRIADYVS